MSKITLLKLQNEGRLRAGDEVATERLGRCVVEYIVDAYTFVVKDVTGARYRLTAAWDADVQVIQSGASVAL